MISSKSDEEPRDNDIVKEALARTRVQDSIMMITMTPLAWITPIVELFDEENDAFAQYTKKYLVSSLDNPFTDKTWTKWLSNEEYLSRVEWLAINPTWLVYNEFNRKVNVISHIEPTSNNWFFNCKYYKSIDFGTSHPTWVLFVCVDEDNNIYVYDEIYKRNTLLVDIAKDIKSRNRWFKFEYTLWDSAA